MKCPICKKTIPDDSLKCPYCKARTGLICKSCHTVNSISNIACKKCGEEILRLCPECGSVNFPNAETCRKCGSELGSNKVIKRVTPKTDRQTSNVLKLSQEESEEKIIELLSSDTKKIISLSGNRGVGKSHVIAQVIKNMQNSPFLWFYGKCTPITQMTPCGLIQDIIFNLFNLPNFCINSNKFRKDAAKLFRNKLPYLDEEEINDFVNFLYPSKFGEFEEITERKIKTFELLNKIFDNICIYSNFILIVDNFDYIDGMSYEFLHNYMAKDSVFENLRLILIYSNNNPSKGYFNFPEADTENLYYDMHLKPFTKEKMISYVNNKDNKFQDFVEISDAERNLILAQSKGNPAYIEQAYGLRLDSQIADCDFELPELYNELIARRINLLSAINPDAYTLLMSAAILGDKINLNLVKQIFDYNDENFSDIIVYLQKMNFIAPLNDIFYQFKDILLWETILKVAKNDEQYLRLNTKVCNSLANYTPNSNAIFGIIAQNIKNPKLALDIWTRNTRVSAYIGDMSLYAMSQKHCLALINELDDTSTLKIRYNISERLGKLLTDHDPKEAMEYLPDAIANAKDENNIPKLIELLAYMTKCCTKTGNYLGTIECVNSVLEAIEPEKKLEITLIKCIKLKSLLAIGNCGEIVNIIDTEIMPVFDEIFSQTYSRRDIPTMQIVETWLKTYHILAEALVMQGNDRSFEILTTIYDVIERNNIHDETFICQYKLTLAQANTIKGDFAASEKILEELKKQYSVIELDENLVVKWNYINIINNFMRHKYQNIQEDLFYVVTYANNNGDNFTKNIMKSLLGKVFRDNQEIEKAMNIYNDQIAYFSKEKMAIGALLTWYLIADATLANNEPQAAAEIAEQALEVAKNPKIDNSYFIILFRIMIAKSYMEISDYETAKIHLDYGIELARKFNVNDLLSRLYLLYGKCFQSLGLNNSFEQKNYLRHAQKMYEHSTNLIKQTKNNHVHIKIEQAKNTLKTFMMTNDIKL